MMRHDGCGDYCDASSPTMVDTNMTNTELAALQLVCCNSCATVRRVWMFFLCKFFEMNAGRFKSFQVSFCCCTRGGKRRKKKKREKKKFYLLQELSLPFGLVLPSSFVPKLLVVGRGVIAHAPSGSSNTTTRNTDNNTTSKRNSKPKEICCFQHQTTKRSFSRIKLQRMK